MYILDWCYTWTAPLLVNQNGKIVEDEHASINQIAKGRRLVTACYVLLMKQWILL